MSEPTTGVLAALSEQLAGAVERAGRSIARVEARRRQAASGIVWGADGHILTADHVLEREEDIVVGLPNGETAAAKIAGRDPGTDLALLRVEAAGLTPIERGPAPKVGHLVLAVGRPGHQLSATLGVASAIGGPARTRRGGMLEGFIRTDAAMLPGFSGGPLVDSAGRLVGLNTSHFGMGAGFALPLETLDRVAGALAKGGKVRRGYLGVSSQTVQIPPALRGSLPAGQETGLLVVGTEPNGPAANAGLVIGDIIVALAGQPTPDTDELQALLTGERVGQAVPLHILRGGEPRQLNVTIGERS